MVKLQRSYCVTGTVTDLHAWTLHVIVRLQTSRHHLKLSLGESHLAGHTNECENGPPLGIILEFSEPESERARYFT